MLIIWLIFIVRVEDTLAKDGNVTSCCKNKENSMQCVKGPCSAHLLEAFAECSFSGDSVRITPNDQITSIKSVVYNGLAVFKEYSSLIIEVPIEEVSSKSFNGINPSILQLKTQKVDKCTFVGLTNLKKLIIFGIDDEITFHKDAFSGLSDLGVLTLREAKQIYSNPTSKVHKGDNIACEHYLCALRNLTTLYIDVSYQFPCKLTFSGIPNQTIIAPVTYNRLTMEEKEAICPQERHPCHYDEYHSCGLKDVCQSNQKSPTVSQSSIAVISIVVVALVAVLIVLAIWIAHTYAAANVAGAAPVVV